LSQQIDNQLKKRFSNIKIKLKNGANHEKLNYITMNKSQLNDYSKDIQKRVQNNETNDFLREIPVNTKRQLVYQENALKNSQRLLGNDKNMIEIALSKRLKKNPKDLLMNCSNTFRQKKEIKEKYEETLPLDERYGINSWVVSLRRPKNFKGIRDSFINVGSQERPNWRKVVETVKEREIILTPGSKKIGKEFEKFVKSDYFLRKNQKISLKDEENLQVYLTII
jgi:hypothetical protein